MKILLNNGKWKFHISLSKSLSVTYNFYLKKKKKKSLQIFEQLPGAIQQAVFT